MSKRKTTNRRCLKRFVSRKALVTACSAPRYEIEKVQDFLKVPEDRLDACLAEFRDYLEIVRSLSELAKITGELLGAKQTDTTAGCFNWCDDGIRKGTIHLETKAEQNAGADLQPRRKE